MVHGVVALQGHVGLHVDLRGGHHVAHPQVVIFSAIGDGRQRQALDLPRATVHDVLIGDGDIGDGQRRSDVSRRRPGDLIIVLLVVSRSVVVLRSSGSRDRRGSGVNGFYLTSQVFRIRLHLVLGRKIRFLGWFREWLQDNVSVAAVAVCSRRGGWTSTRSSGRLHGSLGGRGSLARRLPLAFAGLGQVMIGGE